MTPQEQISKLQGLLARIQKNAGGLRQAAPASPAASRVTAPPAAATAPPAAATAPAAAAVPAAFAPYPAPPPVAFAAPTALPVAPPPSHTATPPMPYAVSVPVPSAADQSVDDLLEPAIDNSELPVDVDVPFDTVPPPVAAAAPPSQAPDEVPIPLVSQTVKRSTPPASEDAYGLESEVSEVRMAPGPRDSDVEVTVAAIEAEAELSTEELSEADLVDLTEGPTVTAGAEVDIDFDEEDEDEQPPASSQRSRVASSMDEALAAAAAQHEAEREVPIKTPPPESGPQEAPAAVAMPPAAAVDSLLAEELEIPTRAVAFAGAPAAPTAEQLGQTIELEEARGPALELAVPLESSAPPAAEEALEVALPPRDVMGGYDDNLMPPPEARDDLEAHRRRQEDDFAPPPESLATLPSARPGAQAELVPVAAAAIGPEILMRQATAGSAEAFTSVRETFRPATFVELLDASLRLGGS